ncbi:MAG: RNA-directed DNA polymerase [Dehalococcoidia bacterium]
MFKKLSELVDLEKAFDEVMYDERNGQDFLPDILHFLDLGKCKSQIVQELKQRIDNNEYQVKDLIKMDVPKGNFFIRPGARPSFQDGILYRALANYIGLKADKKLEDNVYSYRFNPNTRGIFHWSDQWLKFERAFWEKFEEGFECVLKTDITAYFANISIERLRNHVLATIDESEESKQAVDFLFNKLLRPWAQKERNKGFGLPQGITASSIVANLFLYYVDALLCRSEKVHYLRYADDMRVLAKDEINAKNTLKTLITELRRIGLDLNEKKTQVLSPSRVEQELRDPRQQDMDTLQNLIKLGDKPIIEVVAIPLLEDLFERSFDSSDNFGGRHQRFAINRFVQLREIYADRVEDIENTGQKLIANLKSNPGSTNVFSRFFNMFPTKSFQEQLINFLRSEHNIYEWQEMQILDSLLRFKSFSQDELRLIKEIATDRDRHQLTRSRAILLLGKLGDEYERYELRTKFDEESDYLIKRAIIVATQELSTAERNAFYSTIKRESQEQAPLVDFIKSLKEPFYFDEHVPSSVSIIEEQY